MSGEKRTVMVRGLYTTVLSKWLLDNGFTLAHCSPAILQRFRLEETYAPPDVTVDDVEDRQGFVLRGPAESVDKILDMVISYTKFAVVLRPRLQAGDIFKGSVVESRQGHSTVDCGRFRGDLPQLAKVGQEFMVSPLRPAFGDESITLTDKVRVSGKYATMIRGGWVSISKKIYDQSTQLRLLAIANEMKTDKWGLRLRSISAKAERDELVADLTQLREDVESLEDLFLNSPPGLQLRQGPVEVWVNMPSPAKSTFDEVRGEVTPTVNGHHYFKSMGKSQSIVVDFAERLLGRGIDGDNVRASLYETLVWRKLRPSSRLELEHRKLDGSAVRLGVGEVESINSEEGSLTLRRMIHQSGKYDGIGAPKEKGDIAISEFKLGQWFYKTTYSSSSRQPKGIYINICTPIEIYQSVLQYFDLYVDVVQRIGGPPRIIDADLLEKATSSGIVSTAMQQKALAIAKEALRELQK